MGKGRRVVLLLSSSGNVLAPRRPDAGRAEALALHPREPSKLALRGSQAPTLVVATPQVGTYAPPDMALPEYELVVVLPDPEQEEVRVVLRRLWLPADEPAEEVAVVRLSAELWDRLFPGFPARMPL